MHPHAAPALALGLLLVRPQQGPSSPATAPSALALGGVDVPLARDPDGPDLRNTAGVACLDYDGDGWTDLYVNYNGGLFRNQSGQGWTRIADLDAFLPPLADRYGASAGDFDNDGLPDIACEPRGDCFYLLQNLGAANFLEIASDPERLIGWPPCDMFAETFCWGDVDDDGDLDLWATAYPAGITGGDDPGGNRFFENLGPTGPGGAYRFELRTEQVGLDIPPNVNRPEGAQLVDTDRDGDMDGFANGTLYQNRSTPAGASFRKLVRAPSGILLASRLDEGAAFLDYDLDGDQDLIVVYQGGGNVLWENEGDGSFFDASDVLESPGEGATEGCSAEDWDLDGDLDLTTGHIFRRNLWIEGQRFLRIATHSIPDSHIDFPTPAWADFDKDGDPDCVLANWRAAGRLYENVTYGAETPLLQRLGLSVRPVNDSPLVPRGLETEYGAAVELRVHGDPRERVRRRFVASSHGYLQQSEYALFFALPAGPDPEEPSRCVLFDLLVDFPGLEGRGILRIDPTVNPALANLELATLLEREITVFRSGKVLIDGAEIPPRGPFSQRLASTGLLLVADEGTPIPDPVRSPAPSWFVGLELDTGLAAGPLRVEELVLDGQLESPGPVRCDANVQLWDVTAGEPPRLARAERRSTSPRNDRSFLAVSWLLKPGRVYRVLCRVTELRASPRGPGGLAAASAGALSFASANPCDGAAVLAAALDPDHAYLELRCRTAGPPQPGGGWQR